MLQSPLEYKLNDTMLSLVQDLCNELEDRVKDIGSLCRQDEFKQNRDFLFYQLNASLNTSNIKKFREDLKNTPNINMNNNIVKNLCYFNKILNCDNLYELNNIPVFSELFKGKICPKVETEQEQSALNQIQEQLRTSFKQELESSFPPRH